MLSPIRRRTAVWAIFATVGVYFVLGGGVLLLPPVPPAVVGPNDSLPVPGYGLWGMNMVHAIELPDKPGEIPIKVVHKLLSDQVVAWNKGDLEGFMAGYWKSPDLSFYSGRDQRKGWQETHDRYFERYKKDGREMGKLTFSELKFDTLAADTVMVRGRWKLTLSKDTPDGLFTLIVQKKPEGWRIVHDHTSVGEPEKKP
jgi:beta-aspartyl-peptidase (threonine type)